MRLYVCWGTFPVPWPRRDDSWHPDRHLRGLPDYTRGRREVRRLTGSSEVPALVLDDGQVLTDSKKIASWAQSKRGACGGDLRG